MGEFFTSFEASWQSFLSRDEPLEVFSDQFPASPELLAGWFIALDPALWPATEALQRALAPITWLRPYPVRLQHLWLGSLGWGASWSDATIERRLEQGREALDGLARFTLRFPRLNCFHTAVVAEAEADDDRLADLARRLAPHEDTATFLPHLAVSLATAPGDPRELRDVLVPLRDTSLGHQVVDAVSLGVVPLGQQDFLRPWTVPGSVALT